MRTAKAQISLRILKVWSWLSLSPSRIVQYSRIHVHRPTIKSWQTDPTLCWSFAPRWPLTAWLGPYYNLTFQTETDLMTSAISTDRPARSSRYVFHPHPHIQKIMLPFLFRQESILSVLIRSGAETLLMSIHNICFHAKRLSLRRFLWVPNSI